MEEVGVVVEACVVRWRTPHTAACPHWCWRTCLQGNTSCEIVSCHGNWWWKQWCAEYEVSSNNENTLCKHHHVDIEPETWQNNRLWSEANAKYKVTQGQTRRFDQAIRIMLFVCVCFVYDACHSSLPLWHQSISSTSVHCVSASEWGHAPELLSRHWTDDWALFHCI